MRYLAGAALLFSLAEVAFSQDGGITNQRDVYGKLLREPRISPHAGVNHSKRSGNYSQHSGSTNHQVASSRALNRPSRDGPGVLGRTILSSQRGRPLLIDGGVLDAHQSTPVHSRDRQSSSRLPST